MTIKTADGRDQAMRHLKEALRGSELALFLGAGVSVQSGLPSWGNLVLQLYFRRLSDQQIERGHEVHPSYLYAIADWHLKRDSELPEITAQKVRNLYKKPDEFLDGLRTTLYGDHLTQEPSGQLLRDGNPTLAAVADLCQHQNKNANGASWRGTRAIVTLNFDDLLETVLAEGAFPHQAIWKEGQARQSSKLPIFHVHGYVPRQAGAGSSANELVFAEEQYHLAAQAAYSWSSLIQLKYLANATCLMVGLSLRDRNLRRLLDALRRTPLYRHRFALMQIPQWGQPDGQQLEAIYQEAKRHQEKYEQSGVRFRPERSAQVEQIIERVEHFDHKQQTKILQHLGVQPVWYEDHEEVPELLRQIIA